jgi:glycosyltransferase involved in cell wall biosynthesis
MILGIDASNIRDGGGVTHLVELLKVAEPEKSGFSKVIVWSGKKTLDKIEERQWLIKSYLPVLDKNLLYRVFWQRFTLSKLAIKNGCTLLFAPGGANAGNFHPMVTMSRNLLPFEWKELLRYGFSLKMFKMIFLRITQSYSFRVADGLIFLTEYAKETVNKVARITENKTVIIPHGISSRFFAKPRQQFPIEDYNIYRPFRIVYVSVIEMYKHQWNVAEAVIELRKQEIPVTLELIGSAYPPALKKLQAKLAQVDPHNRAINYSKAVSHVEMHSKYAQSDLCIFASSCENMPNILLEGMASGLPIACSNMGPMPEVLEDGGVYFNPLEVSDIITAIKKLIDSNSLRKSLAEKAFEKAQLFSWKICAKDTLCFLANVADKSKK